MKASDLQARASGRAAGWVAALSSVVVVMALASCSSSATKAEPPALSTADAMPASVRTSTSTVPPAPGTGGDQGAGRVLPEGAYATLDVAGPLAVVPTGALYVADTFSEQVLARLPSGRFRVVAGDGTKGVAGDGGPAIRAQLLQISDLAVAADGSLYIVDGTRVRKVSPTGMISTIAGIPGTLNPETEVSGRLPPLIRNGTPARSVSIDQMNSAAIALSEQGQLYISTGAQLLRLVDGRLDAIQTTAIDPPYNGRPLDNLGQIAVDARGHLDVSGGNGWSIWRVAPDGTATVVTEYARRSGGDTSVLERAPDGLVYGESGSGFLKLRGDVSVPGFSFPDGPRSYFWLTNFAFAPDGAVYADEAPGRGGFEQYQQIRVVHDDRSVVLWQQTAADVARSKT